MTDDETTPEFTKAVMARARPARELLSPEALAAFKIKSRSPKTKTPPR